MASTIRKRKEFPKPASAHEEQVVEVMSVWCINDAPYVTGKSGVWDDPAAYGVLLARLAGYIANAYGKDEGQDTQEILLRILEGFNAEIDIAAADPQGRPFN
jgi:hypothetical protein